MDLRIATAPDYRDFVVGRGLDFHPVELDVQSIIGDLIEVGHGPADLARGLADKFGPVMDRNLRDFWAASEDADAIIWGPSGFLGSHIAQARGILAAAADMQPILRPTGAYRSSVFPPLPRFLRGGRRQAMANCLTYVAVHEMFWQSFRGFINRTLVEGLSLRPMIELENGRHSGALGPMPEPALCAWSPSVLERPADYGPRMHVTGYWFLDESESYEPPAELRDFLESGPPPVSVGFGSMNRMDPETMVEAVTSALRETGERAVFLAVWSCIRQSDLPDEVLVVDEVPHEWLFPRVRAAIHHGGAGTTAAALRAGVSSVTVPFFFDQRFWGERVAELGAGAAPIPHKSVTGEQLAAAISRTSDPAVREIAAALARRVRAENGVANAVDALEAEGVLS